MPIITGNFGFLKLETLREKLPLCLQFFFHLVLFLLLQTAAKPYYAQTRNLLCKNTELLMYCLLESLPGQIDPSCTLQLEIQPFVQQFAAWLGTAQPLRNLCLCSL